MRSTNAHIWITRTCSSYVRAAIVIHCPCVFVFVCVCVCVCVCLCLGPYVVLTVDGDQLRVFCCRTQLRLGAQCVRVVVCKRAYLWMCERVTCLWTFSACSTRHRLLAAFECIWRVDGLRLCAVRFTVAISMRVQLCWCTLFCYGRIEVHRGMVFFAAMHRFDLNWFVV